MVQVPPDTDERVLFADLYRRWFPTVVRACARQLGPGHDAEAVAQEAFVRAWRSWEHYADDRPFGPWVSAIARRLCISETRRAARREHLLQRRSSPLPALLDDALDTAVRSTGVDIALRALPSRAQRLLVWRDVEARPYEEIAYLEGTSIMAIRVAMRRARAAFRVAYEQAVGPPAVVAATGRSWWHRARRLLEALPGRMPSLEPVVAGAVLLLAPTVPTMQTVDPPAVVADAEVLVAAGPTTDNGRSAVSDRPTVLTATVDDGRAAVAAVADAVDPISQGGFYSFAVSPNYAEDHTVFALGHANPCEPSACAVLVRSTNGGETWTRLRAEGLFAGEANLVLSPDYPRDARIFVQAKSSDRVSNMLAVSHDEGDTFQPVVLAGLGSTPVAMSPRFAAGDPRILIGASIQPALVYRDDTKGVEPLRLPLPLGVMPTSFAFGAGDGLVVSASLYGVRMSVYRCTATACSAALEVPAFTSLSLAPGPATVPGSFFAWSRTALYRSTDDGRSFEPVALPTDNLNLAEVLPDRTGQVHVRTVDRITGTNMLFVSGDLGSGWTRLTLPERASTHRLAVLLDGVLLASQFTYDGSFACSVDGGRTWASRCRRAA